MTRLVWTTDIHLNFLSTQQVDEFLQTLRSHSPTAILIGGDIAEADSIERYLLFLEREMEVPIYFVLGNHDFYRGSIADVRSRVAELCRRAPTLEWLPDAGVLEVAPGIALIGHDGFYDARLGNAWGTRVQLSDFRFIQELAWVDRAERNRRLAALGDEAARYFRESLTQAFGSFRQVLLLTHVPPFREACWHEGRISDDDWLPFFTCRAAGEALIELSESNPTRKLLVLCGHTHGEGYARVLPNLEVFTGRATYGAPTVSGTLVTDASGELVMNWL